MLRANTSKARLGGKDINVPAPPKATHINAGERVCGLNYKIHYIAISASNFANSYSNLRTFSVIDYKKDLKYKALNENLLKVRDKYGVDIIRYASEELNG